jgi:MGT family glycosyltransferase
VKSLWEGFVVPYARATLPAVDRAVHDYRPDVLVVDQHAVAGALVAHRHQLRWASLATTMMELTQPFKPPQPNELTQPFHLTQPDQPTQPAQLALPKVDAWIHGQLAILWRYAGLPAEPTGDLRFSPYLVVAFTTAALTGDRAFADHVALVGPAFGDRPAVPEFPWHRLDHRRRLVLVSTGTLVADLSRAFYPRVLAALGPLAGTVQAVLNASPDEIGPPPDNVVVAPRVPVLALMPMLDAVVCHGGLGTTSEALAHGVPVVVAPIRHDQPIIANQIVAAGAGIRVPFGRVSPQQLSAAINALLHEPSYRTAAARIRDSFSAAGGASAAALRLQALADPNAPRAD